MELLDQKVNKEEIPSEELREFSDIVVYIDGR